MIISENKTSPVCSKRKHVSGVLISDIPGPDKTGALLLDEASLALLKPPILSETSSHVRVTMLEYACPSIVIGVAHRHYFVKQISVMSYITRS